MSTFFEQTRARVPRIAEAVQQRAGLSVVTPPAQRAPRLPFAAFVLAVLGIGLVGLLVLNTSLQQQAFYARSLEGKAESVEARKEALNLQVDALRSPDRLAREAASMGMLPNHQPGYVFLADGTVRGKAQPADPNRALRLDPKPASDTEPRGPSHSPQRGRNGDTRSQQNNQD